MRRFWKWVKRVIFRSAVTGEFVTEEHYKKNPRETVRETIKVKQKGKC